MVQITGSKSKSIVSTTSDKNNEKDLFKAVFNNVDEAILVVDTKGVIYQANQAVETLTGFTQAQIVGNFFDDVFKISNERGLRLTADLSPIKTVSLTNEPIEYLDVKFLDINDKEIWIGMSLTPIFYLSYPRVVIVCHDITRLKDLDRAKSDFVSMASHELRTPLTVINGYVSLFLNGDMGDINKPEMAHFKKVFSQIEKSTKRLNLLVEDLLNVTRIEEGKLNLILNKIDLASFIKEVNEELGISAQDKKQFLEFNHISKSYVELPIIVNADHSKLREIIINLIDNAIKYTQEGGKITISCTRNGREALISVCDNGPGIPKNMLPRIFDRFQRVEGSYVKDNLGTGLGLYITKQLVKLHGGELWVDSKFGDGATFFFTLPLS